ARGNLHAVDGKGPQRQVEQRIGHVASVGQCGGSGPRAQAFAHTVRSVAHPGVALPVSGLIAGDVLQLLQAGAHHVLPLREHLAMAPGQRERRDPAVGRPDLALHDVDMHFGGAGLGYPLQQGVHLLRVQRHQQQAVVQRIEEEYLAKAGGDHRPDAVLLQAPYGVLAAGAAAEVRPRHQDRRSAVSRLVQHKVGPRLAVGVKAQVVQQAPVQARLVNDAQELLRHDLIGVEVTVRQGSRNARYDWSLAHAAWSRVGASTLRPASAAAAARAGLIRWVRPPRPWRPSKLRLVVDAHRSPGRSTSSFMSRHIEQPGCRHSKPASISWAAMPSASAWARTAPDPGTTMARTPGATLRPRTRLATTRKSSMRPLVHEPMNTRSMGTPAMGVPGDNPI